MEYGRTDDVNMSLILTHFLDLRKNRLLVTDIVSMNTETVERISSSYLTPHNPPMSQSTRPGLVDSKKKNGCDTHRKTSYNSEKGVREGDVREVGGKSTLCDGRRYMLGV